MLENKTYKTYLERYALNDYQINSDVDEKTDAIVVIPSFYEKGLFESLNSLASNSTNYKVAVFIVINESVDEDENIRQFHKSQHDKLKDWCKSESQSNISFYPGNICRFNKKKAGVGIARKAGMDEAFRQLNKFDKLNAPIICYDADSTCKIDFLEKTISHFQSNKKCTGVSIAFEHPIDSNDPKYRGILQYESHLHYYVFALRYAGFPYAFHTVGSSMACRADIYATVGGMNTRKAGEDFYFLHRVIPTGDFGQVHDTRIYPSPRISERVPFGTGRAMKDFTNGKEIETYSPEIFFLLKPIFEILNSGQEFSQFHKRHLLEILNPTLGIYMEEKGIFSNLQRASEEANEPGTRFKKYYEAYNGLEVLKTVHYLTSELHEKVPIESASRFMFEKYFHISNPPTQLEDILFLWRKLMYEKEYVSPAKQHS
ncbi:glycosyltransferase [Marinigracilibium pacificum]|uniref:Glycosyltransferase family 2 protein n=1 Tax=Marinigracilibium pacificum TaxID=2729599 RepID=A0A848IUD4_9BACT|nr:glycosyltransferase [Marinigracilibium pacificum]NMM47947.1 glycosyltransferase family 2 protein [Marinigracilibium pacificum]